MIDRIKKNLSFIYFIGFIVILFLLFLKLIFGIVLNGVPFTFGEIFSLTTIYTLAITASLLFIFYHIGRQIKNIFKFYYVSTGILCFFATTFLINIILGFFGFSNPKIEIIVLYVITTTLLLFRTLSFKGVVKKISFVGILVLIFSMFYILPLSAFPERVKFHKFLIDITHFWLPSSISYFQDGLFESLNATGFHGYGYFVQHIVVTVKRFLIINAHATNVYYFAHYMLFMLVIFWFSELNILKRTKIIIISIFCLHMFLQTWLRTLFFGILMGDGVAALLFAIVVGEFFAKANEKSIIQKILFWVIVGSIYLTKPFIQYLVFLLPMFLVRKSLLKNKKEFIDIILPYLCIAIIPFLFRKLNLRIVTQGDFYANYLIQFLERISFSLKAAVGVIKQLLLDKISLFICIISLPCFILGYRSKFKKEILLSFIIIIINLILVFGLYMILWVGFIDYYDDAYRYLAQIYFVFLLALAYALDSIIRQNNHKIDMFIKFIKNKIVLYKGYKK